jgi:phosphoesterase RecJ-like protein
MFDTGCFQYANSTPTAHRIAADLIQEGAPADEIYRLVYESTPVERIRLLSEVLKTLDTTPDGKIAWLYATQEMFRKTGTTREDVDGFINYIRSIDTVEVVILVSEQENGKSKASFRSKSFVDVGKIAAEFDGGGHARAAGCEMEIPYTEAIKRLVKSAKRSLRNGYRIVD